MNKLIFLTAMIIGLIIFVDNVSMSEAQSPPVNTNPSSAPQEAQPSSAPAPSAAPQEPATSTAPQPSGNPAPSAAAPSPVTKPSTVPVTPSVAPQTQVTNIPSPTPYIQTYPTPAPQTFINTIQRATEPLIPPQLSAFTKGKNYYMVEGLSRKNTAILLLTGLFFILSGLYLIRDKFRFTFATRAKDKFRIIDFSALSHRRGHV